MQPLAHKQRTGSAAQLLARAVARPRPSSGGKACSLGPRPHLVCAKVDVAGQEDDIVVGVAHALAKQLGGREACGSESGGVWAAAAAAGGGAAARSTAGRRAPCTSR